MEASVILNATYHVKDNNHQSDTSRYSHAPPDCVFPRLRLHILAGKAEGQRAPSNAKQSTSLKIRYPSITFLLPCYNNTISTSNQTQDNASQTNPQITSTALPSSLSTNIHRLTRTLSTATGLDAFLATACYTSLFLHTQLPNFPTSGGFIRASPRVPTSGSPALKALYNALEDHRIFSRLFGLFPLYTSVLEAWRKPHRDPVVKTLLYASLAAGTVFQVLENVSLLVGKGVFRGERLREREGWFWAVSHRWWLAQLGLEVLRLARVRQLKFREELGAERVVEQEKEAVWSEDGQDGVAERTQELMEASTKQLIKVQSAELEKRWWRQLYVTAASIPLAVHWSFEDFGRSPISEAVFAGCGMIAGVIGLQDAWEESA